MANITVQEVNTFLSNSEVKIEICGEYGRGINKSLQLFAENSLQNTSKLWFFKVLDHGTSILKTSNVIKAVAAYNKI
jgi:hypothetical protein